MATLNAVGVPIRLLHEAEGHPITVEMKSGDIYRGHLQAAEDTMNVQLLNVIHTARDGRVTKWVSDCSSTVAAAGDVAVAAMQAYSLFRRSRPKDECCRQYTRANTATMLAG